MLKKNEQKNEQKEHKKKSKWNVTEKYYRRWTGVVGSSRRCGHSPPNHTFYSSKTSSNAANYTEPVILLPKCLSLSAPITASLFS